MSLTVKTDDITSGRRDVDPHGRLRGEWVKRWLQVFGLTLKHSEFFFCLCSLDQPTDTAFTTVPTNTTALRSSPMSLNCVTDANPAAHVYQFYLNDSFISNSSSGVLNITVDTDGVYTCVPINKVGTGHNATVSITMVGKFSASSIVFT